MCNDDAVTERFNAGELVFVNRLLWQRTLVRDLMSHKEMA